MTAYFSPEEIVETIFNRADINIDRLNFRGQLAMLFNTRRNHGHYVIERPNLMASYRALFSQGMDVNSLQVLRDAQIETLANEFGIYLFYPIGKIDSRQHLGIPAYFRHRTARPGFEEEYRDELTYMVGAYMKLNPGLFFRGP